MSITTTDLEFRFPAAGDLFAFRNRVAPRQVHVKSSGQAAWLGPVASRLQRISESDEAPNPEVLERALRVLQDVMPPRNVVIPSIVLSEGDGVELVWRANGLHVSIEIDAGRPAQVEIRGLGLDIDGALASHRGRVQKAVAQLVD